MENIIKWLAVGYFTGLICALYLIARTIVSRRPQPVDMNLAGLEDQATGNWFAMTLTSLVVSLGWSFVAGGVYLLVGGGWVFLHFTAATLLVVAATAYICNTANKLDVIALHAIVILGVGILIPIVF